VGYGDGGLTTAWTNRSAASPRAEARFEEELIASAEGKLEFLDRVDVPAVERHLHDLPHPPRGQPLGFGDRLIGLAFEHAREDPLQPHLAVERGAPGSGGRGWFAPELGRHGR
jgi:hypothetical protein